MSEALARLKEAEQEAEAARARLAATAEEIRQTLEPRNLLSLAGQALSDRAVGTLLSKPVLTTLAVSGASYILRNPAMVRAVFRFFRRRGETRQQSRHSASHTPQEIRK